MESLGKAGNECEMLGLEEQPCSQQQTEAVVPAEAAAAAADAGSQAEHESTNWAHCAEANTTLGVNCGADSKTHTAGSSCCSPPEYPVLGLGAVLLSRPCLLP